MLKYWILAGSVTIGLGLILLFIVWLLVSRIKNRHLRTLLLAGFTAFLVVPHVGTQPGGFVGPGWLQLVRKWNGEDSVSILSKMAVVFLVLVFVQTWISRKKATGRREQT